MTKSIVELAQERAEAAAREAAKAGPPIGSNTRTSAVPIDAPHDRADLASGGVVHAAKERSLAAAQAAYANVPPEGAYTRANSGG